MRTLKKYVAGALAAALFALPAAGQEQKKSHELRFGYNAIETAVTSGSEVRSRVYSGADIAFHGFCAGYSGLNEMNNFCTETYYSRNVFTFGADSSGTFLAALMKSGKSGISDAKFGLRNTGIAEKLGGYGFIDLTADMDAANISAFYGKSFGKGVSLGVFHEGERPFNGAPSYYEELQVSKNIWSRLSLFSRAEIMDFDVSDATVLAGAAVQW